MNDDLTQSTGKLIPARRRLDRECDALSIAFHC
jgi:hypothetical protein